MMIFKDLDEIRKLARPNDWWGKYFLHPFSVRLVSVLKNTKVSPNHLTFLSAVIVFLAFPLICWGNYFLLVTAAVLLQISLMLDCADGQLARFKKLESATGEWFDRWADRVKDFLIIFSLTFRYSKISNSAWILGFISYFIICFNDFVALQAKILPILPKEEIVDKKESPALRKLKYLKRKIGLGFFQICEQYFFYSLFLILDRIDWLFYFIIVYGSLAILWFIFNTWRENRLVSG